MLSFPFDSRVTYSGGIPQYDRAVSSQPLRKLLSDLFTTGVMPNPSTCFQVSAGEEGMTVSVSAGYAVINGGLMQEEETRILEVSAADLVNDRIDTVVLRWNENVDVREADLYIVAGTPASEPVRPELTRSGSVYEIGLADVFIPHGTTSIANERITDTRYESERCGIVSSVSEWDTTTIYQQVQADLANFQNVEEAEFMDWFDRMKDQLSEDAAGHLQLEIDELSTSVNASIADIETEINGLLKPRLYIHSDTGQTVTAVKDGVTITAEEIETALYMCDVTDYGNWTINGVVDGVSMRTVVKVNAVKEYEINFIIGATATPTNDVSILLQCAAIYDAEGIETISDVIADETILSTVVNSNNAMDYLVRSTTWMSAITGSQTAMQYIGLNNYAARKLLDDTVNWLPSVATSSYYEYLLNKKNPNMTSNSTPSGSCASSAPYDSTYTTGPAYYAFDGNNSTRWSSQTHVASAGYYVQYAFPTSYDFYMVKLYNVFSGNPCTFVVEAYVNGSWVELKRLSTSYSGYFVFAKKNTSSFRVRGISGDRYIGVGECTMYGREDY